MVRRRSVWAMLRGELIRIALGIMLAALAGWVAYLGLMATADKLTKSLRLPPELGCRRESQGPAPMP
jgi:hypothetical protein